MDLLLFHLKTCFEQAGHPGGEVDWSGWRWAQIVRWQRGDSVCGTRHGKSKVGREIGSWGANLVGATGLNMMVRQDWTKKSDRELDEKRKERRQYCKGSYVTRWSTLDWNCWTTCQCGHKQHACNAAWLKSPTTLLGRGEDNLHVPVQQDANNGKQWHNALRVLLPDVGHICTFGCIVHVTLPGEKLLILNVNINVVVVSAFMWWTPQAATFGPL